MDDLVALGIVGVLILVLALLVLLSGSARDIIERAWRDIKTDVGDSYAADWVRRARSRHRH